MCFRKRLFVQSREDGNVDSDAVGTRVLQFKAVKSLPVQIGDLGDLALTFVEQREVRRRQRTALLKNDVGHQVCVGAASGTEIISRRRIRGKHQLLKQSPCLMMSRDLSEEFLCVIQTPVRHIAHEHQNNLEIVAIDVIPALHSLTDEPQYLQTAKNDLMLPGA